MAVERHSPGKFGQWYAEFFVAIVNIPYKVFIGCELARIRLPADIIAHYIYIVETLVPFRAVFDPVSGNHGRGKSHPLLHLAPDAGEKVEQSVIVRTDLLIFLKVNVNAVETISVGICDNVGGKLLPQGFGLHGSREYTFGAE